jgi:hypothetical protein
MVCRRSRFAELILIAFCSANTSQLKRQHSAEPLLDATSTRKSPFLKGDDTPSAGTPRSVNSTTANAGTPPDRMSPAPVEASDVVGSPFKRQRASLPGLDSGMMGPLGSNSNSVFAPSSLESSQNDGVINAAQPAAAPEVKAATMEAEDEEL